MGHSFQLRIGGIALFNSAVIAMSAMTLMMVMSATMAIVAMVAIIMILAGCHILRVWTSPLVTCEDVRSAEPPR